jgi:enoyl-CoA hydratase
MRSDRQSVYEQAGMDLEAAMAREFQLGIPSLQAEGRDGATRFVRGAGRHGSVE